MRSLLVSLLALSAFASAQSILGTYFIPDNGNGGNGESGVVPAVSVIGVSTITDSGGLTVPNPASTTTEPACVCPPVVLITCVCLPPRRFRLLVDPPQ